MDTERAEVKRVEEFVCPGFQNQTCQRATIELETGPDKGDTSELVLGATAIDPELDVGDKLRVTPSAESPLIQPPGAEGANPVVSEYAISDFERRQPMLLLALIFAVARDRLRQAPRRAVPARAWRSASAWCSCSWCPRSSTARSRWWSRWSAPWR